MNKKDFYREDRNKITMLSMAKDIYGQPSIILKIESSNKIFKLAKKHTLLYIIFTVLSIFFLGILFYLLIEKYIHKRIIRFSSEIKSVRGLKDISKRIARETIGDEISSLILDINNMLDNIEKEKRSMESIEQRLITSEKLVSIGRLSASIAHEINNPTLAISNCLHALKKMRSMQGRGFRFASGGHCRFRNRNQPDQENYFKPLGLSSDGQGRIFQHQPG